MSEQPICGLCGHEYSSVLTCGVIGCPCPCFNARRARPRQPEPRYTYRRSEIGMDDYSPECDIYRNGNIWIANVINEEYARRIVDALNKEE